MDFLKGIAYVVMTIAAVLTVAVGSIVMTVVGVIVSAVGFGVLVVGFVAYLIQDYWDHTRRKK